VIKLLGKLGRRLWPTIPRRLPIRRHRSGRGVPLLLGIPIWRGIPPGGRIAPRRRIGPRGRIHIGRGMISPRGSLLRWTILRWTTGLRGWIIGRIVTPAARDDVLSRRGLVGGIVIPVAVVVLLSGVRHCAAKLTEVTKGSFDATNEFYAVPLCVMFVV
jgi:hypothetical protein